MRLSEKLTKHNRAAPALVGALLAISALSACGGKAATGPTPASSSTPSAPGASAPGQANPAAASVTIVSDPATIGRFEPASVTIKSGEGVKWVFQDANPHTATADDNTFTTPKAGLTGGKEFTVTFSKPGTYPYHCFIHPSMLGTVIVQ